MSAAPVYLVVRMARCGLDRLSLQVGWPGSVNVLDEIIAWLQRNGIDDPIDLVGTEVADDIPGSERFPLTFSGLLKGSPRYTCV